MRIQEHGCRTGDGKVGAIAGDAPLPKSFRIDHPSDPENRYLVLYFSEAPQPQNFYNGIVTLDEAG